MAGVLSVAVRDRLISYFTKISLTTSTLLGSTLILVLLRSWRTGQSSPSLGSSQDREASEPGLFNKHSSFESFTTASGYTYPKIRVFYNPHFQAAKLPKGIPLLVFAHGLGGNATQFAPLLTNLVNVASCLAIDLPGCGRSDFLPNETAAYTPTAFAELLASVIDRYRDVENNQQVVLVGHSMGCSIAALLASSSSPLQTQLNINFVVGMIAICPRASGPSPSHAAAIRRLRWLPIPLFDLLRMYDRRGGLNSRSITRVVGESADDETKRLQQKFNRQSKSAVVVRYALATLPSLEIESSDSVDPWPGKTVWSGIKVPLFLVAGEGDRVTPPEEVEVIARWLAGHSDERERSQGSATVPATEQVPEEETDIAPDQPIGPERSSRPAEGAETVPTTAGDVQLAQYQLSNQSKISTTEPEPQKEVGPLLLKDDKTSTKHNFALKITVLPSPAAHGLLYATSTVHILSGLIESFLSRHVDERLSLGWQLQHLTTSGKWDVKNLAKWQSIAPCSEPMAGVFRAMKTMREVDDVHNPHEFVKRFSAKVLPDGVAMVVDISHESPVYDPKGLEEGGVAYHKFPTVSKLPPTADEVEHFVGLIDQLRRLPEVQAREGESVHPTVGVHCHYGFNRTGFFIVCYLVERLGYKLQDAIEEFALKRAPGIKHVHFINELYVRYAVKMERRGTVVA